MKATVIITGSEFTEGRKQDKNGLYIASTLFRKGVDVEGIILSPDDLYKLTNYIKYCLDRSDLVFISGGLGPTTDDFTRQAVADAIGVPLIYEERCLIKLRDYYAKSGVEFTPERKSMCKIPYGAVAIDNPVGRAIGFIKVLDDVKKAVVALPGVPAEMKPMFDDVLYRLKLTEDKRLVKLFRTFGLKELDINYLLEDIKSLSYNVSPKGVDVFVSSVDTNEFIDTVRKIENRLEPYIYAEGFTEMEEVVGRLLRERGLTVATAESSTGGLAVSRLVNIPGASDYVLGGIVCYSNDVKVNILGVNREDIEKYGAVSEPVARQMVDGVRKLMKADISVGDTGIAGPGGGLPEKPVGLHYIGYADKTGTKVYREIYFGDRNDIRMYISQYMLNLIRINLLKNG